MLRNTYRLLARGWELLTRIADDARAATKADQATHASQTRSAQALKRLGEGQKQARVAVADVAAGLSRLAAEHEQLRAKLPAREKLALVERLPALERSVGDLTAVVTKLSASVRALAGTTGGVQQTLDEVRTEHRAGLRQYHLQLGRLARAVGEADDASDPDLASRSIPLELEPGDARGWTGIGVAHPDPDGREWLLLTACPMCGHDQSTVVNPWNKLLLLDQAPDTASARYDYALCHACGVASATRRPFGSRYRFLLEHFGEVTAKRGEGQDIVNPVLNPYPLDADERERLAQLAAPGVFVSDLSATGRSKQYLPGLLRDRFESSGHVDIIGSLLAPRGARVLEVRAKTGALMDGLRRYWQADVYSMPIWESQQWLVRDFYKIPVSPLIDFDRFAIPFDGTFDLIVCQHMLTHAIRPADFLAELRRKLNPGGHIYLYNEPDDLEFLGQGQSMIAHLNPLHMQTFNQESLARGLAANGFETVFLKRQDSEHVCLARAADVRMTPMTDTDCRKRINKYRNAYDRSILRLDPAMRSRVADEWNTVVERAVAAGTAEFDTQGRLRLLSGR